MSRTARPEDAMQKTRTIIAALGLATLAGGAWFYHNADAKEAPSFRTATVARGDLQATVSATGTLGAVRTVEVGTQASGQIAAIAVDFNDEVRKGQLIARIDPVLQQQAVQEAQAGVAKAQAQLAQAKAEYERTQPLYDQHYITATELATAETNYAVARAAATTARIVLDKARQNLAYTNIYSPIDGVVVERAVDVGQTVAASLSAPKLFVIANDLSHMQILAAVDESDIGLVKEGQPVSFTVQSFASQSFHGTVQQVRLNSATTNNVVNYTAVVAVENPDGKLLPGMTATVKFVTGAADDVLSVPNTALRFRPTGASNASPRAADDSTGTLWTVDAKGTLTPHRVRVGLSDGQRTQVTGAGLGEGMTIVVGASAGTTAAAAPNASANPLQPQAAQRAPGRGGPPGPF
jgi:HlyD family secretion protein